MKRSPALLVAFMLCLTVAVYLPALNGSALWDDDVYLTRNPLVTGAGGFGKIWFSREHPSQYFPLVYSAFRAQYLLWGLDLRFYHLVNVLLHAGNALLLWAILRRLAVPGALLGAALWALHPMQVESVAWITELKNTLSTVFLFGSLLAWVRHLEGTAGEGEPQPPRPTRRRSAPGRGANAGARETEAGGADERARGGAPSWGWYATSLALFVPALFAKTTASTIPALLVAVIWWRRERLGLRRLLEILPFAVLGVALGLLTVWWERAQGTVGSEFGLSPVERLLVAGRALWFYVLKLLWPAGLAFSYPRWAVDSGAPLHYLWPASAVAVGLGLWWLFRRGVRGPALAGVVYAGSLAPLLGFISLYTFRYSYVADHYAYVALAGPMALAAAWWSRLQPRPTPEPASVVRRVGWWLLPLAVIGTLSVLTWKRAAVFRDPELLWRDTIRVNPESWLALGNLGALSIEQGRHRESLDLLSRAAQLKPDDAIVRGNLGVALLRTGRLDDGIAQLTEALRLDPTQSAVRANLDFALLVQRNRRQRAAAPPAQTRP